MNDHEKAKKWDKLCEEYSDMKHNYEKLSLCDKDFLELFLDRIIKGTCNDCGETNPCSKHRREDPIEFYGDQTRFIEKYQSEKDELERENKQLKEKIDRLELELGGDRK